MTRSLKHEYRLRRLTENVKRAERQLITENSAAKLLIEAMNDQDLQKASAVIDKLRGLKGKGIKSLDSAIEQAETQLNKYTGGGPLVKGWAKLKGIAGFDNPLVKFMTFANALETGFRQMPTILKNNLGDVDLKANQDQTISQFITDPDKIKTLTDNMLKALSPKGLFSAFKKVPYVDKQVLVQDLLNVPIKNLGAALQQINAGPNSEQIATDLKDTATASGDVASKSSTGTDPAQGTSGAKGTSPARQPSSPTPSAPTGQTPERPSQNTQQTVDNVYKQLSNQLVDAVGNEQRARAMLKLLADEGKLKTQ